MTVLPIAPRSSPSNGTLEPPGRRQRLMAAAQGFALSLTAVHTRRTRDPVRDGFLVAATVWCLAIALGVITGAASDAVGWYVYRLPNPYVVRDYSLGFGFYFTPPMAFAIYPLLLLPWPIFAALWTGMMFAALYYLVGRWAALAILFPPVWWELQAGNLSMLTATASLVMLRWPPIAAFLLLTKITPGVGLLWFAVRREWRPLAIAVAATASIAAITFGIAPQLWADWFDALYRDVGSDGPPWFVVHIPLAIRFAGAAVLVGWGARADRRWTLPVAVTIAAPVLWFNALAGLVGVVRGRREDRERRVPQEKSTSAKPLAIGSRLR